MIVIDDSRLEQCASAKPYRKVVALERRLRGCRNVTTLGVRPNFSDYTKEETSLICRAETLYYPSCYYVEIFRAMGKETFPSYRNYLFAQDKIKQTALFQLLRISHPRTRVFYGKRQKSRILQYFSFPLIAKIPRGSAMGRGVYLIQDAKNLETYCNQNHIAYIQEYLPITYDIRVVVIGKQAVHAYIRTPMENEFRSNLALGAKLSFDNIPIKALELAQYTADKCGWNDVGIDICEYQNQFFVLEANMKYGKQGFFEAGIDFNRLMESLINHGKI